MDILPLLDELQTIARNGLTFAKGEHDQARYGRLLELASHYYGVQTSLPTQEVQKRLSAELGYITPKVGADAAIFNEDGHILLMQRSDDHKWCLPCGLVDPGESTSEAVIREVFEETQLQVLPVQLIDVFTRIPSPENGPHHVVSVVYYCQVSGGTMGLSQEGLDLRYWPIDDVTNWHRDHHQFAARAYGYWKERYQSE